MVKRLGRGRGEGALRSSCGFKVSALVTVSSMSLGLNLSLKESMADMDGVCATQRERCGQGTLRFLRTKVYY